MSKEHKCCEKDGCKKEFCKSADNDNKGKCPAKESHGHGHGHGHSHGHAPKHEPKQGCDGGGCGK